MKKLFLSIVVFVMAICANAQTNQYFWYQGKLIMGNPIAQIDSVTFGNEDTDSIFIYLPRTIIKEVHDTIYITIRDTVCLNDIPEGALAGEFSVSATKKVRFSKGNLQYQASTGTWRFAEKQYNIIGTDNNAISSTNEGWIDLFGWGTSGYNNKYPYMTSRTNSEYGEGENDITGTYYDWGMSIANQLGQGWYTMTNDEMEYLLYTRNNAASLRSQAIVCDIAGYIILPDNFIIPNGLTWTAQANNWTSNTYSMNEWSKLEALGAVFLPAAGVRVGTNTLEIGTTGVLWSSSHSNGVIDQYGARRIYFSANSIGMNGDDRLLGQSVRLVQDIEE